MEDLFNEALHSNESGKQFKYLEESYKNLYYSGYVCYRHENIKGN
jgi:hypothetical protein